MVHLPEVRADLTFETSDALSSIDFLGTSLDGVVTDFSQSFGNAIAGIQTDFGSVADGVASNLSGTLTDAITGLEPTIADLSGTPIEPQVTADTTEAGLAIDDLSGVPVDVEVTADTSEAESSIEDLGTAADSSTGSLDGLSAASSGLSATAGLAAGDTGALAETASNLGPKAGAAVAGVGALAGIFSVLFNAGVTAESQMQRFNTTVGDQAPVIEQVHIGNLNTTLDSLAHKLGSTTSEFKNSIATIFQHGQAAGFSTEKTNTYADGLGALAGRALAANPSLGSLADVTTNIERALARGGPALSKYNISLASTDITATALAQTGKTQASQLTTQEKAYAGLTLATAKYGDTLKEKIEEGSKNPLIEQNKLKASFTDTLGELGKPLIAPMFDLIKAVLPIVKEFGKIFAELAKAILPALLPAIQASLPAIRLFADLMTLLAPALRPLVLILTLASSPLIALTFAVQHFDEILNVLSSTLGPVLSAIGGFFVGIFNGALSAVNDVIGFFAGLPGGILGALGDLAGTLFNAGFGALKAFVGALFAVQGEILNFFSGLGGAILGALGDVGGILFGVGRDLINGLIHGITSIGSGVFDTIKGIVSHAVDDVKHFFGISSPSKVFAEELGLPLAQGIAAGILGGGDAISAALGAVIPTTAVAVTGTAAVTGTGVGAGAGGGIGPSQTNNFYGYSPAETAAVNGREWTRMTRFAGV